jgi:hypothetical protein
MLLFTQKFHRLSNVIAAAQHRVCGQRLSDDPVRARWSDCSIAPREANGLEECREEISHAMTLFAS